MKLQQETKIFIGVLLFSIMVSIIASAAINDNDYYAFAINDNDYYAFVGDINDFTIGENGVDLLNVTCQVGYIKIIPSSTYTFTSHQVITQINLTQPGQINTKIRNSIIEDAATMGFNIKKIIFQQYSVVNP